MWRCGVGKGEGQPCLLACKVNTTFRDGGGGGLEKGRKWLRQVDISAQSSNTLYTLYLLYCTIK